MTTQFLYCFSYVFVNLNRGKKKELEGQIGFVEQVQRWHTNVLEWSKIHQFICEAWWRWCRDLGLHGCFWNRHTSLYGDVTHDGRSRMNSKVYETVLSGNLQKNAPNRKNLHHAINTMGDIFRFYTWMFSVKTSTVTNRCSLNTCIHPVLAMVVTRNIFADRGALEALVEWIDIGIQPLLAMADKSRNIF